VIFPPFLALAFRVISICVMSAKVALASKTTIENILAHTFMINFADIKPVNCKHYYFSYKIRNKIH
jgi:hypothetical protein